MKYEEFLKQETFSQQELIAMSYGRLIDNPPEQLLRIPSPPFLMLDRITELKRGTKGRIVGEKDVKLDAWFFQCHFSNDPVQPGCLGVDAIWQLVGFYIALNGGIGTGRALGCQEVDFFGQVRPHNKLIRYEVDILRFMQLRDSGASMAIGDAKLFVDDEHIYTVKGAKVGSFMNIAYLDYPNISKNALGGIMER